MITDLTAQIYMSLLLQTIMSSYVWIMSLCFIVRNIINSTVRIIRIPLRCKITAARRPFVSSSPRLSDFITRIEKANFLHATNSFMVDFAEAQFFYVIAIAVAVIYADSQGAIFNGADNYPSVVLNQSITGFIIYSAYQPIIIVQLSIHRVSMDSIYTLVFSTTALVLAAVAATLTEAPPSIERFRAMFSKDRGLAECGGHPSLRAMCAPTTDPSRGLLGVSLAAPSYFAWVCVGVLVYLWYLKLLRRRSYKWAQSSFDSVLARARRTDGFWAKALPILKKCLSVVRAAFKLLLFVFQIRLAISTVYSFNIIINEVKGFSDTDYDRHWNLGQVVALLAWVPVISKYTYTLICKLLPLFDIKPPSNIPGSASWAGK